MQRDKFDYTVPDMVWQDVIPEEFQNRVVCLSCFDTFASEKEIDISGGVLVDPLYFVGDKIIMVWQAGF